MRATRQPADRRQPGAGASAGELLAIDPPKGPTYASVMGLRIVDGR